MMFRPLFLLCVAASSWAAEICCPDIGCFTDDPPFNKLPLPWCTDRINPSYTIHTRMNPDAGHTFNHTSAPAVFSNSSMRTAFVIHGYLNNGGAQWLKDMKDAFLDRENINVVIVGWEGGADIPNYLQAASNTRSTGAYTALVVDNLVSSGGGANSRMWCVGHSLGSHVCGHAGMRAALGRITADIAGCSHSRAHEYMTESIRSDCFNSRSSCTNYNNIPGSCSSCTCGASPCAVMGYAADSSCQTNGIFYLDIQEHAPYCVGL